MFKGRKKKKEKKARKGTKKAPSADVTLSHPGDGPSSSSLASGGASGVPTMPSGAANPIPTASHGGGGAHDVSQNHSGGNPPVALGGGEEDLLLEDEGIRAKALFDYEPDQDDEISLKTGDIVLIYERDVSGWWTGECNGKYGLFPGAFVKVLDDVDGAGDSSSAQQSPTTSHQDESTAIQSVDGEDASAASSPSTTTNHGDSQEVADESPRDADESPRDHVGPNEHAESSLDEESPSTPEHSDPAAPTGDVDAEHTDDGSSRVEELEAENTRLKSHAWKLEAEVERLKLAVQESSTMEQQLDEERALTKSLKAQLEDARSISDAEESLRIELEQAKKQVEEALQGFRSRLEASGR